jgi:hypothetical protein
MLTDWTPSLASQAPTVIGGERGNVEHPRNLWELGLPAMTLAQAIEILHAYISIPFEKADIGSAL